jgi:streptogramin lyase
LEDRRVPAVVVEYPQLAGNPGPFGITQELNDLWFTETNSNQIQQLSTTGTLINPPIGISDPGAHPVGITHGPSTDPFALWFTEAGTTTGGTSDIDRLGIGPLQAFASSDDPKMITAGPDGNLWYTNTAFNQIVKLNPVTHVFSRFPLAPGSAPWGITAGQDGNIWFTELGFSLGTQFRPSMIGRLNPTSGHIDEFAITTSPPANPARPYDITATATGVAFTEYTANKIGVLHYDMTGSAESAIATVNSGPWGIARGPDGNLYFLEQAGNKVGWANSAGVVQGEFPALALANSLPTLITLGPDNNLWFTEQGSNRIGAVNWLPATQLRFSLAGTILAGQSFQMTVQALDASGAVSPTYRGTVHFGGSDAQATLPADYTFSDADMGQHTFTVTLRTAGSQTVTATDAASGIGGSAAATVSPAPAASLVLNGLPVSLTAGTPATVTVTLRDPFGNIATGYRGTVAFAGTDPRATFPPIYTFSSTDNGVHAFPSGVTLRTAGAESITATDTANPVLASRQSTTVNPGAPRLFRLNGVSRVPPALIYQVRVDVEDAEGNIVTGYTGRVHFSSTDPDRRVSLPADYSFTPADGGTHTFPVALITGGVQTITVSDSAGGISGTTSTIVDIFGSSTAYPVGAVPNAVVTADLNGDGKPDLVTVNPGDGTISVLLGRGDGTFQPANSFPDVDVNPWTVTIADVNGDGIPDLIVGHFDSSDLTIWTGLGDGTFINPVHIDGCPGCPGPADPSLTTVILNGVVNTERITGVSLRR